MIAFILYVIAMTETTTANNTTKDYAGLELWDKVYTTDMKYTKDVSIGGRTFTNVETYYQIKTATGLRWPIGGKRGLKDVDTQETDDGRIIFKAFFYYPGGEFPVQNSKIIKTKKYEKENVNGKRQNKPRDGESYRRDEDGYKKIMTNSLSKWLSMLWFNADIYLKEAGRKQQNTPQRQQASTTRVVSKAKPTGNATEYKCAVSGEKVSEKVANFSTSKYGCFLTMDMQKIADAEFNGMRATELVDAMKIMYGESV